MNNKGLKGIVRITIWLCGIVTISSIMFLFFYIFWKGKEAISWSFVFGKPEGVPIGTEGGIFPALMGSICLGALSAFMGGLLGVAAAMYLSFYVSKGILYRLVQISVSCLSGFPSIIFGLVGYTLLIYEFGIQRSLLCASITVAAMILPFITIRAQKVFQENSAQYMKASLGLGISKEYTIRRMIVPSCMAELSSTVITGMAYGMGAVAPIMYTGAVMVAEVPNALSKPIMTLPYHLYMLVINGFSAKNAYGTAFVLMILLLLMLLGCKSICCFRKDT